MILNCGAILVQWRPFSRMKTVCLASPSVTAEQLRQQLDSLHKEADNTRDKANNARLRLMRLSEAVEKLRRQASLSVQTGKEDDARELLFQKKKVMQAMEKLMTRIELFDKLSAKLLEAISTKESLLIGNMAMDLEVSEAEAPSPVRIVSPLEEIPNNTDDSQHVDLNNLEFGAEQEAQVEANNQGCTHTQNDSSNPEESISGKMSSSFDNVQGLRKTYTYEDLMTHLDQQLNKIEEELETFIRCSNLLSENKGKLEYSKVQHATEILEGIYHIRESKMHLQAMTVVIDLFTGSALQNHERHLLRSFIRHRIQQDLARKFALCLNSSKLCLNLNMKLTSRSYQKVGTKL